MPTDLFCAGSMTGADEAVYSLNLAQSTRKHARIIAELHAM